MINTSWLPHTYCLYSQTYIHKLLSCAVVFLKSSGMALSGIFYRSLADTSPAVVGGRGVGGGGGVLVDQLHNSNIFPSNCPHF